MKEVKLENCKLIQGDCLDILKEVSDNSADLILTDPPYNASAKKSNLGFSTKQYSTINQDWDKGFNPNPFLDLAFKKIKNGGSILVFCSYHILKEYLIRKEKVQQIIHWEKTTPFPSITKTYTFSVEYIVWYSTPSYTFNKHNVKTNVIRHNGAQFDGKNPHPSPKPIGLIEKLLSVHSNDGDLILDPFMGSGTTGIACHNLNRRFYGIEKDLDYFNIAAKRIKDEQKQLKLF